MAENIDINDEPVSFKEGARGIWRHVRAYNKIIILLGVLGIISAIANGFVPYVTGRFFDALIALSQEGSALMFFGPLVSLGYSWQILQNGITASVSLERIFKKTQEDYHPKNAQISDKNSGSVEFVDVSFRYEKDQKDILSHLSFVANPGQVIAFVGESGVGKSSATSLISGYYFPTGGRVLVDGVDTREWDLAALRSRTAFPPCAKPTKFSS